MHKCPYLITLTRDGHGYNSCCNAIATKLYIPIICNDIIILYIFKSVFLIVHIIIGLLDSNIVQCRLLIIMLTF